MQNFIFCKDGFRIFHINGFEDKNCDFNSLMLRQRIIFLLTKGETCWARCWQFMWSMSKPFPWGEKESRSKWYGKSDFTIVLASRKVMRFVGKNFVATDKKIETQAMRNGSQLFFDPPFFHSPCRAFRHSRLTAIEPFRRKYYSWSVSMYGLSPNKSGVGEGSIVLSTVLGDRDSEKNFLRTSGRLLMDCTLFIAKGEGGHEFLKTLPPPPFYTLPPLPLSHK